MTTLQVFFTVLILIAVTAALRFLPFVLFGGSAHAPAFILYLGRYLPGAMISLLVVYCLKDVSPLIGSHGLPEALSILLIIFLHTWRHNTLLSIGGGTVCYMLLIQLVFHTQ